MDRFLRIIALFSILLIGVIGGGCTTYIQVRHLRPAKIDITGVKRVAVLEFEGPFDVQDVVGAAITSAIFRKQHFQVVERDQMRKVMKEQELSLSGVVDPATAKRLGKMLGVDAVIFGTTKEFGAEDKRRVINEQRMVGTGEFTYDDYGNRVEVTELRVVPITYVLRTAAVAVMVKMVNTETGQLLATENFRETWRKEVEEVNVTRLPQEERLTHDLSDQIAGNFADMVAPTYTVESRAVASGEPPTDQGVKFLKAGLHDRALAMFQQVADQFPADARAHYNIGVTYECMGDYDRAAAAYEKATSLDPDDDYIRVLAFVRSLQAERERLRKQVESTK